MISTIALWSMGEKPAMKTALGKLLMVLSGRSGWAG